MGLNTYKSVLKVEHLDALMESVAVSNNPVTWVIAVIKILFYAYYLTTRIKMIELENIIKKQEAEIANEQKDQEEADAVFS